MSLRNSTDRPLSSVVAVQGAAQFHQLVLEPARVLE